MIKDNGLTKGFLIRGYLETDDDTCVPAVFAWHRNSGYQRLHEAIPQQRTAWTWRDKENRKGLTVIAGSLSSAVMEWGNQQAKMGVLMNFESKCVHRPVTAL